MTLAHAVVLLFQLRERIFTMKRYYKQYTFYLCCI